MWALISLAHDFMRISSNLKQCNFKCIISVIINLKGQTLKEKYLAQCLPWLNRTRNQLRKDTTNIVPLFFATLLMNLYQRSQCLTIIVPY